MDDVHSPNISTPSGPLRDHAGTPKFRHQAIAVVMSVDAHDGLRVLLHRRHRAPFSGGLALVSGPVDVKETIDEALLRHLDNAGVHRDMFEHFEQVETRSDVDRDPYDRTIATVYLVLLPAAQAQKLGEDTTAYRWVPIKDEQITNLAFDHSEIVQNTVERLRAKITYSNISFALAPEEFTILDLNVIYRHVLGFPIDTTNLGRVLSRRGLLVETGEKRKPHGGGRPARVYRFVSRELSITDPSAMFRPAGTSIVQPG
ncbi:NUDIX hydrolase [Corynebacterium sp. 320]|nr:NUDIX hydrolase [Corynebacterium sp. 320]KAB1550755.1 NUDIX hydrolase [Corynebacterium sp. 321]KAB1551112.1 NUDIX hydrolase [Corynebacterium sp. 319]KAB3526833.1 NUDIX hydrolase [Corynebacterium sp. 250]KAB3538326.1 NUDIX hydrolase [Corynebacterium sp. 366]QNP92553.1 NUDIX hydrolase [Corynebacterium zhongnanshanii]